MLCWGCGRPGRGGLEKEGRDREGDSGRRREKRWGLELRSVTYLICLLLLGIGGRGTVVLVAGEGGTWEMGTCLFLWLGSGWVVLFRFNVHHGF